MVLRRRTCLRVHLKGIDFQFRYTEFGLETTRAGSKGYSKYSFQFRYTEFGLETDKLSPRVTTHTGFQFRYTEFGLETEIKLRGGYYIAQLSIPLYGIWS